jgi:drug/metabolite transporter (DMT)-like permease
MHPLFGIALQVSAMLFFSMQAACVRYVSDRIPLGEIGFARAAGGLLPLFLLLLWQGKFSSMWRTSDLRSHLLRGWTNVSSMFCNFAGLARLPLADATAIGYAAPLFAVVLAATVLGEVVRLWRWCAVIIGFSGVLLMLSPHLGQGSYGSGHAIGAMLSLSSAFLFGIALTQIRHMTARETTGALAFYYCVIAACASLVTIFWGWVVPSPADFGFLIALGVFGGTGQILLTESLRYAAASVLAPFAYTSMIWATTIGFFWFNEVPAIVTMAGAGIVIGAGLFVIWREHQLGLDRKRAPTSPGPTA